MSLNDEPQKWCKKCVKLTQIHENTWLMDLEIIQCRNTCGQSAGHNLLGQCYHSYLLEKNVKSINSKFWSKKSKIYRITQETKKLDNEFIELKLERLNGKWISEDGPTIILFLRFSIPTFNFPLFFAQGHYLSCSFL